MYKNISFRIRFSVITIYKYTNLSFIFWWELWELLLLISSESSVLLVPELKLNRGNVWELSGN